MAVRYGSQGVCKSRIVRDHIVCLVLIDVLRKHLYTFAPPEFGFPDKLHCIERIAVSHMSVDLTVQEITDTDEHSSTGYRYHNTVKHPDKRTFHDRLAEEIHRNDDRDR